MLFSLAGILIIFFLLVGSELLWRKKKLRGESARKFVHILVGSFVAFWPFFVDMQWVYMLCAAFFIFIILSKKYNLFHAIHGVNRWTIGEILFPVGIALAALFAESDWIFAAAVLHMSLADGAAGLIGSKYGKKTTYKVLGSSKSLIGSAAFVMTSMLIIEAVLLFGVTELPRNSWSLVLIIPLAAAVIENVGIKGTDNVLVPVFILLALNSPL